MVLLTPQYRSKFTALKTKSASQALSVVGGYNLCAFQTNGFDQIAMGKNADKIRVPLTGFYLLQFGTKDLSYTTGTTFVISVRICKFGVSEWVCDSSYVIDGTNPTGTIDITESFVQYLEAGDEYSVYIYNALSGSIIGSSTYFAISLLGES